MTFYSTCIQYSQENKMKRLCQVLCLLYIPVPRFLTNTIFYVTIYFGLFNVIWFEPQNDSYNYFTSPDMTLDNKQM